ncbi:MAG: TM1266 family iron-only hydrogenase system putative regulator [Bacteroidales bacterium]
MEKRIGTTIIRIHDRQKAGKLNQILSSHANIIIGRQGLPQTDGTSIISLVLEGTTDEIGSLTGQIGRIPGIQTKSVLLKND